MFVSDEGSGSALRRHHDGDGAHALERGLADGVRVCVCVLLSVRHWRCCLDGGAQAQRAVAAGHDGW